MENRTIKIVNSYNLLRVPCYLQFKMTRCTDSRTTAPSRKNLGDFSSYPAGLVYIRYDTHYKRGGLSCHVNWPFSRKSGPTGQSSRVRHIRNFSQRVLSHSSKSVVYILRKSCTTEIVNKRTVFLKFLFCRSARHAQKQQFANLHLGIFLTMFNFCLCWFQ